MTKQDYDNHNIFPVEMVTLVPYDSNGKRIYKRGDTFIAVEKKFLGGIDFSFIDSNGHPHYFDTCSFKYEK